MKRLCIAFLVILFFITAGCQRVPSPTISDPTPVRVTTGKPPGTPGPIASQSPIQEPTASSPAMEPTPVSDRSPAPDAFVRVADYIPSVLVDLKYATQDNITGKCIYSFTDAYLRYGTVQKLQTVQSELQKLGYGLKIWDGFRPVSAQYDLWNALPDPTYVADPTKGFSSHSRGNTIDITLVDLTGREVSMPTGFDDFSKLADRDYGDVPAEEAANAVLLEEMMLKNGFRAYFNEWWHYTDTVSYPVENEFVPAGQND